MPKEAMIENRVGRFNTAKVASLTQITTLEGFLSMALKVLNRLFSISEMSTRQL